MISDNLEQTLHRAVAYAKDSYHEFVTLEHLLFALLEDIDASPILTACGANLKNLEESLSEFLDTELQAIRRDENIQPQPTAGFQRVLQRAAIHVQSSGRAGGYRREYFDCDFLRARKPRSLFFASARYFQTRCGAVFEPWHCQNLGI